MEKLHKKRTAMLKEKEQLRKKEQEYRKNRKYERAFNTEMKIREITDKLKILSATIYKKEQQKKGDYKILPRKQEGLFLVINNKTNDEYEVDVLKPNCSCKKYKYTKLNEDGSKKPCKHISVCKSIENSKI